MWSINIVIAIAILCFAVVNASVGSGNRDLYRVTDLEQYGSKDEMYAGLMSLNRESTGNGAFFFWLAKKRQNSIPETNRKLVFWLNGGPGCSSMVGMMWENGPFSINSGENGQKYDLKSNPYSWNELADVVFVEQPIRVGFSPAAENAHKIRNEDQVGEDFRSFLVSFLVDFPEYKDAEIFLSGESYAGFYIPWIAEHIVSKQLVPKEDENTKEIYYKRDVTVDNINLVGAAIGNGVLDFLFQEPSYAEYAYYHGLIPRAAKDRFEEEWVQCLSSLERENKPLTRNSFNKCDMMAKVLEAAGQPNEYDTSTFIGYDKIIKAGGPFDTFFQDPDIQRALHVRGYNLPGINFIPENYAFVQNRSGALISTLDPTSEQFYYEPPTGWKVCYDQMDDDMKHDHPVSAVPVLQFLVDFQSRFDTDVDVAIKKSRSKSLRQLESSSRQLLTKHRMRGENTHLRVMLYSGELDLNCNTLGTLHTLEHNSWRKRNWEDADRGLWKTENNEVAGEYFHFDNIFSFLIVRNSGHLLPMDKPKIALEMLHHFLKNESFLDQSLPKERFYRRELIAMKASATMSDGQVSMMAVFAAVGWLGFLGTLLALFFTKQATKDHGAINTISPTSVRRSRNKEASVLEMVGATASASIASMRRGGALGQYHRIAEKSEDEDVQQCYGSVTFPSSR